MSKVKSAMLSFPASSSPDVVGYKLYISEAATPVDAVDGNGNFIASSYDLGLNTEIDLSTLPNMVTTDGVYNLGVTAIDDAENESNMSILNGVALDFTAPDAPGALTITRS